MSGRAILATIYDDLSLDSCLLPLLDELDVSHGSDDDCDQPRTSHVAWPIRRFQQNWPSHFTRAVVAFGDISKSPHSIDRPRWMEDWTFRVGAWAQKNVTVGGAESPGDLWALDVHDHIVRILAWDQKPSTCSEGIAVLERNLDGAAQSLSMDVETGIWSIVSQFRWTVISRGLVAPQPGCACVG